MAIMSIIILPLLLTFGFVKADLRVGFYNATCPEAESTVRSMISDAVAKNPRNAPILLRLHFHDCFVDGCDGSILLDNGEKSESNAFGHFGLEGFEVIESVKSKLESVCQGVVSCADIVALAARDAIALSNGPAYEVPTGRRDGRLSTIERAANMPVVDDPINILKSKFADKGLSDHDLVLLTAGAHTIGTTACFFMQTRLFNFSQSSPSDPAINPAFLFTLKSRCLLGGDALRIPLDPITSNTFDDQPFSNLRDGFAVLNSDARLMDDPATKRVIEGYLNAGRQQSFQQDFVKAIVKMGQVGVNTGADGEIRKLCSSLN